MKREDAEEFTQSLEQIGEGWWRQMLLAKTLGVPEVLGVTYKDWAASVTTRMKLSIEDRKEAVKQLNNEGMKQEEIAATLGVGLGTVNRDLHADDFPNGKKESNEARQDAGARGDDFPNGKTEPKEADREVDAEPKGRAGYACNTGNNEWYTPAVDIARARRVLGRIDLDPASSDVAQTTVKAKRYFTQEEDGLAHEWSGKVWLNPPYAKGSIEPFVAKLVSEYVGGNVEAAILLTNNSADTEWFHKAATHACAICLTRGRIKFDDPNSDRIAPLQGQAFFYFGSDVKKFASAYASVGVVMLPYRKGDA